MREETARAGVGGHKSKVFWTDIEKSKVIKRAREIQLEHPDLAGLPLLRAAMTVLPVSRRRKVVAVTQATWFEEGLREEIRRSEAERIDGDSIVRVATAGNQQLETHNQMISEWRDETAAWRSKVLSMHDQMLSLFSLMLIEIRALNANLHADVILSGERKEQSNPRKTAERGVSGGNRRAGG